MEPLKRSSLAVQRAGWAGRAAFTCSPFFTLILGKGTQVQFVRGVLKCGLDQSGKIRDSSLNLLLAIL